MALYLALASESDLKDVVFDWAKPTDTIAAAIIKHKILLYIPTPFTN
jgi:hypothetical protein